MKILIKTYVVVLVKTDSCPVVYEPYCRCVNGYMDSLVETGVPCWDYVNCAFALS